MESNEIKVEIAHSNWLDYLTFGLGILGFLIALLSLYLEIRYRSCSRSIKCCCLKIRCICKI